MSAPVQKTATSRAKADPASTLELVVDNGRSPDPRAKGRPLPWAICIAVWAVLAAGGWGVIALLFHWI